MEYSTGGRSTCDNPATNVAALACPSGVGHEERIEGETSGSLRMTPVVKGPRS